MIWIAVILLAIMGFVLAARVFGLPKPAYALLGSALALGLAGYALQGSPDQAGAPTLARPDVSGGQDVLITARRAMFGPNLPPARYVAVADGFARQGQTQDAAGFLRLALRGNPQDAEAWTALGNALVAHAQGNLTPAASTAYQRATQVAPDSPAPAYFAGLALLRSGRALEARDAWTAALELVPMDAPYRSIIAFQLQQLDEAIRTSDPQRQNGTAGVQPAP